MMTNNAKKLSMREKELLTALNSAINELFRCASGYTKNAVNEACRARDLIRRIGSEMDGGESYE